VKYEFGDDVRDIDWNVTARLGEPYRKKFVEEREITLMLLVEDSPTLRFGSGAQSKRDALLELASLVMLLAAVNRDRVGFLHVSPGGCLFRQPVRGRSQILHSAATLLSRPVPALRPGAGTVDIPWKSLSRAAPKHSILIWLGDFPPKRPPEGWALIRRRYQTIGFRVDDPWESRLPPGELFAAYDPASERLVTLEGSGPERAAQAEWRKAREAAWADLFPDRLSRLVVGTGESRLDALVKFFRARMGVL